MPRPTGRAKRRRERGREERGVTARNEGEASFIGLNGVGLPGEV